MDTINIYVNRQTNGIAFSLAPAARKTLTQLFSDATPMGSLFVTYASKSNFDSYHGKIEPQVVPALLGLNQEADLKRFDKIIFLDPITNDVLYTYPNDKDVQ